MHGQQNIKIQYHWLRNVSVFKVLSKSLHYISVLFLATLKALSELILTWQPSEFMWSDIYYCHLNAGWSLIFMRHKYFNVFVQLKFCPRYVQQIHGNCYLNCGGKRFKSLSGHLSSWQKLFVLFYRSCQIHDVALTLIVLMWRIGWAHNNARK